MITILGYNSTETEYLNKILKEANIPFKYSLLETKISRSDKIILPHPTNFTLSYRKLNMMNLFSFLKFYKKPILGLNDGFSLMCNQLIDKDKCGLGFFDMSISSTECEELENGLTKGILLISRDSKLLDNSFNGHEVEFNPNSYSRISEYAKSEILYENKKYSLTFEHDNYYGFCLDFSKNETLGSALIRNFLNIKIDEQI
jgi:imidazoleglycerol phosphate synthase glutamine amidotransferase subunit HisH